MSREHYEIVNKEDSMGIMKAFRYFFRDVARAGCTSHHRVVNEFKKDEEGNMWVQPSCRECRKVVGPATPVLSG
jgi:hypothetical protein